MEIREILQKRAKLIEDQRALLDSAPNGFTAEQEATYNRMEADIAKLEREKRSIENQGRLDELEKPYQAATRPDPQATRSGNYSARTTEGNGQEYRFWDNPKEQGEYPAFERLLLNGYNRLFEPDKRALQMNLDTAGGYVIAPTQHQQQLIKAIDNETFVNDLVNVVTVEHAHSLGVPTLENDPSDAQWTSELATGNEDTTMSFGKRELHPHPLAKRIKVSNKFLRAAGPMNPSKLVIDRMGYKHATVLENAFLNGNGAGQPLGVFTASNQGISTSRDVSTDNTTTAITADGLINAYHKVKPQYRKRANWLFHDDSLKMLRKIKDGEGQYLWQPGLMAGTPDTLLGRPIINSQFAPSTFTTGLHVGIFGDFKTGYMLAYALQFSVQVLTELYAETNQTGFIGRLEADGMPTLEECFSRVKLA